MPLADAVPLVLPFLISALVISDPAAAVPVPTATAVMAHAIIAR